MAMAAWSASACTRRCSSAVKAPPSSRLITCTTPSSRSRWTSGTQIMPRGTSPVGARARVVPRVGARVVEADRLAVAATQPAMPCRAACARRRSRRARAPRPRAASRWRRTRARGGDGQEQQGQRLGRVERTDARQDRAQDLSQVERRRQGAQALVQRFELVQLACHRAVVAQRSRSTRSATCGPASSGRCSSRL